MNNTWDTEYRSPYDRLVANTTVDERVLFIRRTYAHLFGAILLFAGLCFVMLQTGVAQRLTMTLAGSQWGWVVFMVLFMVVSVAANKMAMSATSMATQYAGLGLYVLIEAIIVTPLLWYADTRFQGQNIIANAAVITLLLFGGMSAFVMMTKQDFSFLRSVLMLGGLAMCIIAIGAAVFGFHLGMVYIVAGVALACGYILYDTSNVLHHYRTTQHVAAALALFSSVALLFWYVLRLLMELSGRRN